MVPPVRRGSGALAVLRALGLGLLFLLLFGRPALAIPANLLATEEQGWGRLVLSFPGRLDLPGYRMTYQNGVLTIGFDEPVNVVLPDIGAIMPRYAAVARVDADGMGLRIGLKTAFQINKIEAGERLFIDLLPQGWQGQPPPLPAEVITELAERAKKAAALAAEQERARLVEKLKPQVELRVGQNPTFLRLQFDWSIDTEATYTEAEGIGEIVFGWPVPVDMQALVAKLPDVFKAADNRVTKMDTRVRLKLKQGVQPRFYVNSKREFMLDIDTPLAAGGPVTPEEALAAIEAGQPAAGETAEAEAHSEPKAGPGTTEEASAPAKKPGTPPSQRPISPKITEANGTVRVVFPFDDDTAAAAYRRGNTLWLLFDTLQAIGPAAPGSPLSAIADDFIVTPNGETQAVRIGLRDGRLATLSTEGTAWVLSLGDVLLDATEPMTLTRSRNPRGEFSMAADVERPARVHVLHDPDVGDTLKVVTVLPPARGLMHSLTYVDFDALQSIQGLVIAPKQERLDVTINGTVADITLPGGLTLSSADVVRTSDAGRPREVRDYFVDLGGRVAEGAKTFIENREILLGRAAMGKGRQKDAARQDLAVFLISNQFGMEALGVLDVLDKELSSEDMRPHLKLLRAIANTVAGRSAEAIELMKANEFKDSSDVLVWRAIAKAATGDYAGARQDAEGAEAVYSSYPQWVRNMFLFAGLRGAVETGDEALAQRLIAKVEFAVLDPEQMSHFHLLQGRVQEMEEKPEAALNTYQQVIAADIRPTRAEAIYRTLQILDKQGKLDLDKAIPTLSAEALMWRGNLLEAAMQKLLVELYFKRRDYRDGFATVKQTAAAFPDNPAVMDMTALASKTFEELFLNGGADALGDVAALSLFYDFREMTPPGRRGDELIRNLARRLVKVGLLKQASDLLTYQIDNRLDGIGRAQVATELAIIRLADRDPQGAIDALNHTRMPNLPPQLDRQRRILEARALIDAGRQDFAVDLISRLTGRDADLLRVDALWKAGKYGTAATLLDQISTPQNGQPLDDVGRQQLVRAAVGYVLARDSLALSRLRAKYAEMMAQSPEAALFKFVTEDVSPESLELKKLAQEISGRDALGAFLKSYNDIYGGADTIAPETGGKTPG